MTSLAIFATETDETAFTLLRVLAHPETEGRRRRNGNIQRHGDCRHRRSDCRIALAPVADALDASGATAATTAIASHKFRHVVAVDGTKTGRPHATLHSASVVGHATAAAGTAYASATCATTVHSNRLFKCLILTD